MPQPVVTYGLLAVTSVISLLDPGRRPGRAASRGCCLDKFAIYFGGEYWRLLTVVLVHGSLIHLLFNMYALWIIGPIVEALYGPSRYLGIYLLCAAAGSAASYATSPSPAVGASGAVFGLFGALLVADRVHKPALTRNARNLTTQIGILIGVNLVIGFSMPGIDNAAHIGGLAGGRLAGLRAGAQGRPPGLVLVPPASRCRRARPSRPRASAGRRTPCGPDYYGWEASLRSSASSCWSWPWGPSPGTPATSSSAAPSQVRPRKRSAMR